ncbi:hypothetical protein QWZ13_07975 [Reinekea marina]|nr:hypothetical protein [Reinekea marina]MDN3648846.1 hypothetical protein [Reinekea marina]
MCWLESIFSSSSPNEVLFLSDWSDRSATLLRLGSEFQLIL